MSRVLRQIEKEKFNNIFIQVICPECFELLNVSLDEITRNVACIKCERIFNIEILKLEYKKTWKENKSLHSNKISIESF